MLLGLRRYLVTFLACLSTFVSLVLIISFSIWWLFLLILILWIASLLWLYFRFYSKTENFVVDIVMMITTVVSITGLILLVEWNLLRWLLLLLCVAFIGMLFLKLHRTNQSLSFQQKPIRRIKMMLWVFDVYALLTILFAVSLFFPGIPFVLLALFGSVVCVFGAIFIWQMYYKIEKPKLVLWGILLGLISFEFIWVIHLLPLGYLVLGFLVAWLWFIIQLFVRFHFSPKGIIWKKQLYFLLTNLFFNFLILFFIVRWI